MYAHYLRYVLRHKWFVLCESIRLGIPVRGLLHDLSKFLPSELPAYAEHFYGGPYPESGAEAQAQRTKTKGEVQRSFDKSWLLHQHRNDHHWQFWVLRLDDGGTKALPMPENAIREMVADWRGAGRAITGVDNTQEWYLKNAANMLLHPLTRQAVEALLSVVSKVRVDEAHELAEAEAAQHRDPPKTPSPAR